MSKHIDRQYKLEKMFCSRLSDIYRMASEYHYPHSKIIELKNEAFFNNVDRKKCTRITDSFITGYDKALFDSFRNCDLTYGYRLNGVFLECRSQAIQGKHQTITELKLPCICVYKDDTDKEF